MYTSHSQRDQVEDEKSSNVTCNNISVGKGSNTVKTQKVE